MTRSLASPTTIPTATIKLEAEGADEAIVLTVSGPAIPSWCLQLPYKHKVDGVEFSELEEAKAQEMGLLPGWASERPQVH
jgi:hypothetical protein